MAYWIDTGTGTSTNPGATAVIDAVRQYATNGGIGQQPTIPGAEWFNMVTDELLAVLDAAGIAPDKASHDQVISALNQIFVSSSGGDMAGPLVLYNGSTAPTAEAADNSLKIANTAFVKRAVDKVSGSFGYKNLKSSATGISSLVAVTADAISVIDSAGKNSLLLNNVNITNINLATSGANGLDTGAAAVSTWYALWVIYNPTTDNVAGLLSLSAAAPTMPVGYTHKARVGWIRSDSTANKFPLSYTQAGRRVQYKVASGSNLTILPTMASGVHGSPATPTFVSVSTVNFAPPTAAKIQLQAGKANVAATVVAAPSNSYGAYTSPNRPPIVTSDLGTSWVSNQGEIVLESNNIYVASDNAACFLNIIGWEDNL